ncbi:MAG: hypothetical protein KKH94_06985 [Candidatus Omnitrophica bacterium]|nr:hypothetical protein [Candidatus Omnitrophota bacterium]
MKTLITLFLAFCILNIGSLDVFAGFDDILKEALLETKRPIGSDEYIFSPGDEVIKKTAYSVYYSGYVSQQGVDTLLFAIFEGDKSYTVQFPSPDVIQIKDVKIKIVSYDNLSLRIQLVREPVRTYR